MSHQPIYEFGDYRLDVAERQLLRDGESLLLQPKVFDLLLVLVEQHGHLLEKDELLKLVWPDTIVEEANLTNNISSLRKTLGDNTKDHHYIETVPRRGYRFVAEVKDATNDLTEVRGFPISPLDCNTTVATIAVPTEQRNLANAEKSPRKRRQLLIAGVVLVGLALWLYYFWSLRAAAPVSINSLAVLPFQPLTAESHDEALELGMADTLISRLSGLRQLIVRPLGAVRNYAQREPDAVTAGKEQRVEAVLESHFQRARDRFRVTARLVRVADGTTVWTGHFDEQFTNIFAVQDSIAEQVAQALALPLTGVEQRTLTRHSTENQGAYQLYVKGLYHAEKQTAEHRKTSLEFFQQALVLDPNYALAYAKVAASYLALGIIGELPQREAGDQAHAAAVKALQLDETLVEGHAVLAAVNLYYDWNWMGTERECQRALQLNPTDVGAVYGIYLSAMGRFEEALVAIKKAQELDPLSLSTNLAISSIYYYSRQYDRTIEHCHLVQAIEPNLGLAYGPLGKALVQKGRYPEAIAAFQQGRTLMGGGIEMLDELAHVYALAGRTDEARKLLHEFQRLDRKQYGSPYNIARVYVALGETEQALQWLERAYQERAVEMIFLKVEPQFDRLRSDPRFDDLLLRVGFPR